MKDALNLGRALAKVDGSNTVEVLKEYQDEMLQRTGEAVRKSRTAALDDGKGTMEGWSSWSSKK
jgi:2-polyprenyl-6-methoxyphenol hydroxylase-like FAD-dependent oxidoreductase